MQSVLVVANRTSTLLEAVPRRLSRWLHVDLVSQVAGLGLPVTHVEALAAQQ